MLVIRRIHVSYRLKSGEENREVIQRVHDFHHDKCPVYRTLKTAIEISTDFELEPVEA